MRDAALRCSSAFHYLATPTGSPGHCTYLTKDPPPGAAGPGTDMGKGRMEAAGNCGTPRRVPGGEADAETPRPCGPALLDPEASGAAPTLS
ncbi:unnamed protein product [Rangifer tarandus platyrhynchus]|uniref:Uncharacterized protein n=1 Tax=Rangifer tarandus platyrhynchus TaxID=3082113 RepID=A0AC59Z138_RANTA